MIRFFLATLFCFSLNSHADDALKLALNWKAEPEFGGFYQAQKDGLFTAKKLNVQILEGGSGTPVIQTVAAGQVPFGIVSADELILSRANGSDVVAIFAVYQTNPQGIMVHQARGFQKIEDVFKNDGTLAWQSSLPYALFLQKKFAPLKVKTVPYLGGIANFLTDPKFSQQCFVTSEPLTAEKSKKPAKTFLVAEAGYNPYTALLVTSEKFLKKNPEVVKNMVLAVRSGWERYLESPQGANELLHQLNPSMDMETLGKSATAQKSLIATEETKKRGLGAMTVERWTQLNSQMVDLGLVKKTIPAGSLFRNF